MRHVLTDPSFLQDKLRAVGGPQAELVSRTENEREVTLVVRQTVLAQTLPSLVRSLLPGDLTITRAEYWTGLEGGVHASVDSAPAKIVGRMWLEPDTAGSILAMQLEATVKLPLIGGKLEKAITDSVSKLIDVEHGFTVSWLNQAPTS